MFFFLPIEAPGELDPLSFHNLCLHMHVNKPKFERNRSLAIDYTISWPVLEKKNNLKRSIGFMSKTTALHVHHAFLTFLWCSLHDYKVKPSNATFCGGRGHTTTDFHFSLWTWIKPYIWQIERFEVNAIKFERKCIFIFQWCFHCRRRRCCLRWLDPVILWGYYPTLTLSGIPTFSLILSLTYSMDNI